MDISSGHFMDPDAHTLFCAERLTDGSESSSDKAGASMTVQNVGDIPARGRRRGRPAGVNGRRRSAQGHRGTRRQRGRPTTQVDHPLEGPIVTDHVTQESAEIARDVKQRQTKVQVSVAGKSIREIHVKERDNSESEGDEDMSRDTDGQDDSILEGEHRHFEWSPMESYQNEEEEFKVERTGSVSTYTTPYDAFRSYWDEGILQFIVDETNRHAKTISSAAFQTDWYPTNSNELLCHFAFWMMSGIIKMPNMESHFSTNVLLKTEIFGRITTRGRHNNLNRALHFVNTELSSDAPYATYSAGNSDPMHRLNRIIDHFNSKFQSNYVLSKDICIDRSLTLWKGRLNFRQYVRSQAARSGLKTFELCESTTGYLWSFLVCTGKQNSDLEPNMSQSAAVVRKLIKPLLNKGYRLFMDDWFNSPVLARFLKRNGTDCVGTVSANRQHVPKLVTEAPLKQGQLIARHSGDVCVLSWQDRQRVTLLSTCHDAAMTRVRALPLKPQALLDYNRSMGGVDLKDQMLEPYLLERRRRTVWCLKLFKRLLDCSIHNAHVLLESSSQSRIDSLKFRLELVESILNSHHHLIPQGRQVNASVTNSKSFPHAHILHHSHWPVSIAPSEYEAARNRKGRRKCVVCVQQRKIIRTSYRCEGCDVALCVENCFKQYHTIPH